MKYRREDCFSERDWIQANCNHQWGEQRHVFCTSGHIGPLGPGVQRCVKCGAYGGPDKLPFVARLFDDG